MQFRQAIPADIQAMHTIRCTVRQNPLPDPDSIAYSDYEKFITVLGRGWVAEEADHLMGFAIVDLSRNNVWALFVEPAAEGRGIGRRLQEIMLDWYFAQTLTSIWLGTGPSTRASRLYSISGWTLTGIRANGELRFEMSAGNWNKIKIEKSL